MKRWIVIGVVLVGTMIFAISWFLTPDNLRGCSSSPSEKSGCERADVVIAVSGGDTRARTNEAIGLYKRGWAPRLAFSGAASDKAGPSNAEVMKQQAIDAGIPSTAIIIDETSENTRQNAENTTGILQSSTKSAILVTSGYHQRRALLEFRRRAPQIDFRAHPVASDNQWSPLWWLTPWGWYVAITEIVKIVIFYVMGVTP
jgi:uncharacterized SAM-binding protein YcdF (DUF218 family)